MCSDTNPLRLSSIAVTLSTEGDSWSIVRHIAYHQLTCGAVFLSSMQKYYKRIADGLPTSVCST